MFDAPTPTGNPMSQVSSPNSVRDGLPIIPSRSHREAFRVWTGAEIVLLQTLRKRHTMAQIARRLNRSEYGVKAQARRLGIKKA